MTLAEVLKEIKFNEKGLIPVITQDALTGEVLMQAYMNKEALEKTLSINEMVYFSRSRNVIWHKGESSGHFQKVVSAKYDCDGDCLLFKVVQKGNACHTGAKTCFHNEIIENESVSDGLIIKKIINVIKDRKINPVEGSYTNYLLKCGSNKICKKIGEEATEVVIATINKNKDELTNELADLVFHALTLMVNEGIELNEVYSVLEKREGKKPEEKYKNR